MQIPAQNVFYAIAAKTRLISGYSRAEPPNNDVRRKSHDWTDSPPPYSTDATRSDGYFSAASPREAKRIRRARYFIDGSVRRKYSSSSAIITSFSENDCRYSPSIASSSVHSLPGGLSPLHKYFFPPIHRRTTSDSATAMSVVSSTSAPCSLSSGSYSSTSSSYSGYSTSVGSGHRRARSHASSVDELGMVRRTDGRPVNALPGERFEQRWITPFAFRRVSPAASQPVSPKTRSFSPAAARTSNVENCASCGGLTEVRDGESRSDGELGRGGKHKLGGLRELGKKLRRRVASRRRNPTEIDPSGAGLK